jgi:hypothetical protein
VTREAEPTPAAAVSAGSSVSVASRPASGGGRGEQRQGLRRARLQRHLGNVDPAQLLGVEVDVDQRGVLGDQRPALGRELREATTEGEDRVGVGDQGVGRRRRPVTEGPAVEPVVVGEGRLAQPGRHHRQLQRLRQLDQAAVVLLAEQAAAGDHDRPLGAGEDVDGALDQLRSGQRMVVGHRREGPRLLDLGDLHVEWQREEDRAGTTAGSDPDGALGELGDAVGDVDLDRPLGDRLEEGEQVHLLEGVSLDDLIGDLADQGDDRHRLGVGVVDADREVGGARPARGEADADLVGAAGEAVGHVGGALLVADGDVAHAIVLGERVDQVHHRRPRQAEDMADALAGEGVDRQPGAGDGGAHD